MVQILETFVRYLEAGNVTALIAAIVLVLILKGRRFVEDFDWHRSRRIRLLQSSLECEILDASSRTILAEELRMLIFGRACGQRIEAPIREVIVRLNEVGDPELTLWKLVAASRFLKLNGEGLPTIEIPAQAKVDHAFNVLLTIALLLLTLTSLLLIATQRPDLTTVLQLIGATVLFAFGIGFVAVQSRPYVVAGRITADVSAAAQKLRHIDSSKREQDAEISVSDTDRELLRTGVEKIVA